MPVSADARLAGRFLKKIDQEKRQRGILSAFFYLVAGLGGGTLLRPAGWDYEGHAPPPRLLEIEAIKIHDFGPGGDEVFEEFFLRITATINFCQSAQFRIRAEDEINT